MTTRKRNQDFFSVDPQPIIEIVDNPELLPTKLTPTERSVLNVILSFANHNIDIYPRQDTVASLAGCCRITVNRCLKKFELMGLMSSSYNHLTSKDYRISSWFYLPGIRRILSKFFKSLNWLPILVVTQLISPRYLDSKSSSNTYVNTHDILSVVLEKSRATTREEFLREFLIQKKTKDLVMSNQNAIPPYVQSLNFLNLSQRGQIELSIYPEDAIVDSTYRFKRSKNIRDPFAYFCKLCNDYCQREGAQKNHTLYQTLMALHKPGILTPMVLPKQDVKPLQYDYDDDEKSYYKKEKPKQQPTPVTHHVQTAITHRPIPEILAEFEKFSEILENKTGFDKWDRISGPGAAEQYIKRVVFNLKEEFNRASYAEARLNPGQSLPPYRDPDQAFKDKQAAGLYPKSYVVRDTPPAGLEPQKTPLDRNIYLIPEEDIPTLTGLEPQKPEHFCIDGIPHAYNQATQQVEEITLAKKQPESIVDGNPYSDDYEEVFEEPEDDTWEAGRM
jgi:hypothetical protein